MQSNATFSMEFDDWCNKMSQERPQFKYWSMTLKLECLLLVFVRSLREANFELYVGTLMKLMPWFCALDHIHYTRWLTVHIRDMVTLKENHPLVYREFLRGNFVVHKTTHMFSGMGIDQAHEQNNAEVKGYGGAVGLTENLPALCRWMVAGPEMSRLISEFDNGKTHEDAKHHEQTSSMQTTFMKEVKSLVHAFQEMGNPFMENSNDLLTLDTKHIAGKEVIDTINKIENLGQVQYRAILDERILSNKTSLFEPIKKNKLPLFSMPVQKSPSYAKEQLRTLKKDCSLFSRLYIACQTRDGNLDEFFQHENQCFPPSLSRQNEIYTATKSDLLGCLEKYSTPKQDKTTVDAIILDGAAIVNMVNPGIYKTFGDYAIKVFLPHIKHYFHNV